MSLMKILNTKVPRIDTCWTPNSILQNSLKLLPIFTL